MAKFVLGQPVVTAVPNAVVDAGLPVGQHLFQLEVLTDSGQKSAPDIAVVQVEASVAPLQPVPVVVPPVDPSTLTPVVAPSPIVSPVATPIVMSVAATVPKTVSPSTTSGTAIPSIPPKTKE